MSSFYALLIALTAATAVTTTASTDICIIGSGISGSSAAYFLKNYSATQASIHVFERRPKVGGRMATITIANDTFEAGASIIHPKNLHARRFAELLGLEILTNGGSGGGGDDDEEWLGIWDGEGFVFKTLPPPPKSSSSLYKKLYKLVDKLRMFRRYGLSLLRMNNFVKAMLDSFMLYYSGFESRPTFETVDEMLKWTGLYSLTQGTLEKELTDAGVNSRTISEIVTVITRINYGQSVRISGLAGAVSLAGSDDGLWAVKGGNWQLAAGLLKLTNATLHLNEAIELVSDAGDFYVLKSNKGNEYNCNITVVATPLDEVNITMTPPVSLPSRKMQHTYTTFVRGIVNPKYFGLTSVSEVPVLIGTLEVAEIPFSSISVLKKYNEDDMTYKIFSRAPLDDGLLDQIFSTRTETIRINWPAYPHYEAPETFAPILLDKKHLYYINTFESAASAIETGAVAAENVARLIISRLPELSSKNAQYIESFASEDDLHVEL